MLSGVGTKDRKCEACVAAARSRHSGPSAADGFLCHGVRCRGKKRQPRLEFSKNQIKNGEAHKVCRTCAAVVDKAALDGGTPGNSCLVHTVSSSVCSAFVQPSFGFRRVPARSAFGLLFFADLPGWTQLGSSGHLVALVSGFSSWCGFVPRDARKRAFLMGLRGGIASEGKPLPKKQYTHFGVRIPLLPRASGLVSYS